jgi:hypothetical protein
MTFFIVINCNKPVIQGFYNVLSLHYTKYIPLFGIKRLNYDKVVSMPMKFREVAPMNECFCQKCGIMVEGGDVYCHHCGAELRIKISGGEIVPEIAEYCAMCGSPAFAGDRFCSNCGTDRAVRPESLRISDERAGDGRVSRRKGRPRNMFKIALGVLFWGSIFIGCYAVYRHFWSDIPWNDVAAVMTEPHRDTGSVLSRDVSRTEFPPIAPETASPDTSYSDAPQIQEPAPVKLAWGVRGEDGISVLVLPDGSPAPDSSSLPGSVTGSRVRLRAEPGTNASVLDVLGKGDGVGVVRRFSSEKEKFVWYNVRTEKGYGWMYGEFVRVIEDE